MQLTVHSFVKMGVSNFKHVLVDTDVIDRLYAIFTLFDLFNKAFFVFVDQHTHHLRCEIVVSAIGLVELFETSNDTFKLPRSFIAFN